MTTNLEIALTHLSEAVKRLEDEMDLYVENELLIAPDTVAWDLASLFTDVQSNENSLKRLIARMKQTKN